jgi:hypothetical protein
MRFSPMGFPSFRTAPVLPVGAGMSGLGPNPHQPVFLNSAQRHVEQPEPKHFPCLPTVNQK